MSAFNGFLDNILGGVLNPKGNLGDWRHASRTFVKNNFRLAPKTKFLYHVYFDISKEGLANVKKWDEKHRRELGLLVKSASLPSFSSTIETKKRYNKVKHHHTSLNYEPINITFHDDNMNVTTTLMEAYYRYYFVDGNYSGQPEGYGKTRAGDDTYTALDSVKNRYGLDVVPLGYPFFNNIQISLLTRHTYQTFVLVNPLIQNWSHGDVSAGDSQPRENSITVVYETVWYKRGAVTTSTINASESPLTGFGDSAHYDQTPSPITLAGGGSVNFGALLSGGADLFDYAFGDGEAFNSPLGAILAGVNLIGNAQNLTPEGILEGAENILGGALENVDRSVLGGLSNINF